MEFFTQITFNYQQMLSPDDLFVMTLQHIPWIPSLKIRYEFFFIKILLLSGHRNGYGKVFVINSASLLNIVKAIETANSSSFKPNSVL